MMFSGKHFLVVLFIENFMLTVGTYPYVYIKASKGRLCFKKKDENQDMKMTATSCCKPENNIFSFVNNTIRMGDNCIGYEGDSIQDGKKIRGANAENCGNFVISSDGYLRVKEGSTEFCIKEFDTDNPIQRSCVGESPYIFYTNGTCPAENGNVYLVRKITRMVTPDSFTLTDDSSKLKLTGNHESPTPTVLEWYSNKELYVVGNDQSKSCLIVDEKSKLHELGGLELDLNGDDCKGQKFEYREDLNTFEFLHTDYCWKNEGSNLVLRRCSGKVFTEITGEHFSRSMTSYLASTHVTSSSHSDSTSSFISKEVIMSSGTSINYKSSSQSDSTSSFISKEVMMSLGTSINYKSSSHSDSTSSFISKEVIMSLGTSINYKSSSQSFRTSSFTSKEMKMSLATSVNYNGSFSLSRNIEPTFIKELLDTEAEQNMSFSPTLSASPSDTTPSFSPITDKSSQAVLLQSKLLQASDVFVPTTSNLLPTTSSIFPTTASYFQVHSSIAQQPTDQVNHGLQLAEPGQQCEEFCRSKNLYCSSRIDTGNSYGVYEASGVRCKGEGPLSIWKNAFDPSYDKSSRTCLGYVSVNETVLCTVKGFYSSDIRRLCKCVISVDENSFGPWLPWSTCTVSCNTGTQQRSRMCKQDSCNGERLQTRSCNTQQCPIDGGFSDWTGWSICSKPCGGGAYNRTRTCNNPYQKHGGYDCFGTRLQTSICNVHRCPVDGMWTMWTQWSACDKPCNGGWRRRWRYCTNPAPLYGGRNCEEESEEKRECNTNICPAENITAVDVRFDKMWKSQMGVKGSLEFEQFSNLLKNNSKLIYQDTTFSSSFLYCSIDNLREGSIIATFTLYFTGLDSFQMLLLQDAIQDDKYVGKLKIISSNSTFTSALVPSSAPANFTLTAVDTTTIRANWKQVEDSLQNGIITGYILFYKEMLLRSAPYRSIATVNHTVTLQGLKTYTKYIFRVLAYNRNGNGLASETKFIYTGESAPSSPPLSVEAVGNSAYSVIVSWVNLKQEKWNGVPAGILLMYSDQTAHKGNKSVTFPKISETLENLIPLTTYIIDVCAFTSQGNGPCERVQATTLPSPPSKAPGNISVETLMSHNSLKVSWLPINLEYIHGDLKGYKVIYRLMKTGGVVAGALKEGTQLVHPSLTEVTLKGLQPNSQYYIYVLAFNENGDGKKSDSFNGDTCACPEIMYTNFAASAPYMYRDKNGKMKGLVADILSNMTSFVCGTCKKIPPSSLSFKTNGKNFWAEKKSIKEVKFDIDDYVHISFPIFGNSEMGVYSGYAFVPVFGHPGVIYFIVKDSMTKQIHGMLINLLDTWPIFLIIFLMITLSGYFIWIFDRESNPEDFSPRFSRGIGSGIYWSFVTMGTHGYGDLTPKGVLARIYAIIWILISTVCLGIFTGALTTAITVAQVYDSSMIYGVQVAAIQDSEAYKIGLLRNAKMNEKSEYKTIEEVAAALKNREVRGALVDVYSAADRNDLFDHPDIIAKKNIKYPNAYGIVLSGEMQNAASSFRAYLSENADKFLEDVENRAAGLEVQKSAGDALSMFDSKSKMLQQSLWTMLSILIIGFVLGTLHYFYRSRRVAPSIADEPLAQLKLTEKICNESITKLHNSVEKIESLIEKHLEERRKKFGNLRLLAKKNETYPLKAKEQNLVQKPNDVHRVHALEEALDVDSSPGDRLSGNCTASTSA